MRTSEALTSGVPITVPLADSRPSREVSASDSVADQDGNESQKSPTAARKARAGRLAARQSIQAVQSEAASDVAVANTADVDALAGVDQATLDQYAGRLALQDTAPAPANESGPVVGIRDFEAIFTRFQAPLINYIFRLVGNRDEACDLAQDTFVKAYRSFSGGVEIQAGALSSWLYRIASNVATDALRRRRLITWLPMSIFNEDRGAGAGLPDNSPVDLSRNNYVSSSIGPVRINTANNYGGGRFEEKLADREIVERVLRLLPDKYRLTLLLYEHQGFSVGEVAEMLHIKSSAVKMRLMRARERFIALYKQEGGEVPGQVFVRRKPEKKGQKNKQAALALTLA